MKSSKFSAVEIFATYPNQPGKMFSRRGMAAHSEDGKFLGVSDSAPEGFPWGTNTPEVRPLAPWETVL